MGIKEIALRIGEEADEYADAKLQSKGEFHPDWYTVRDEYFAEALISSYKAELLKEVGEQVAWLNPNNRIPIDTVKKRLDRTDAFSEKLYTSDQVAAAILKATGPLEEEIDRLESESEEYAQLQSRCFDGGGSHASVFDEVSELRAQLATAEQQAKELSDSVAQKVAEACADLLVDRFKHEVAGTLAIRQGEWRKFVKEV